MGRSRQTTWNSSAGHSAPAVRTAFTSAHLRSAMTSNQMLGTVTRPLGTPSRTAASFLNHENVLGSFYYPAPRTSELFTPTAALARVPHPNTGQLETWLSVQFSSRLDGAGIAEEGRPPLSLVLVLDISGSMSLALASDLEAGSKLQVVKQCVFEIIQQLNDRDKLGIVVFNHTVHELFSPTPMTDESKSLARIALDNVHPGGGTNLSLGFKTGMDLLEDNAHSETHDLHRVMFLTDMESTQADENSVLQEANERAASNLHTTVVGVGVDLSVGTVEALSKVPGGKYISVSNAQESRTILGMDFAHDVWPIAFGIQLQLPPGVTIDRVCGSPELNEIGNGSSSFTISSEFSTSLDTNNGNMQGGILLVKLLISDDAESLHSNEQMELNFTWHTIQGFQESKKLTVTLPPETNGDIPAALRKALALVRFVDLQNAFCNSTHHESQNARIERLSELKSCKQSLLAEMEALNDRSLLAENKSFIETLDRIIEVEERETSKPSHYSLSPHLGTGQLNQATNANVQAALICPITKSVMTDPVCTVDGHTFERSAIERWLETSDRSPVTGLKLTSKNLTPNHVVRSLIRDFALKSASTSSFH